MNASLAVPNHTRIADGHYVYWASLFGAYVLTATVATVAAAEVYRLIWRTDPFHRT